MAKGPLFPRKIAHIQGQEEIQLPLRRLMRVPEAFSPRRNKQIPRMQSPEPKIVMVSADHQC